MPAIIMLKPAEQEKIRHLRIQLSAEEIVSRKIFETAFHYLVREGIYDVVYLEERHFRRFKKELTDGGLYSTKLIKKYSGELRKVSEHWRETEFESLLKEIRSVPGIGKVYVSHIEKFLCRAGACHIEQVDYPIRCRYEQELRRTKTREKTYEYLKAFDRIKQHHVLERMARQPMLKDKWMVYDQKVVFLPYLPDKELMAQMDRVQDKEEMVWDFTINAPESLKKQVFFLLKHVLENLHRQEPAVRRARYLLPLKWLYEYCAAEGVEDIGLLELEQIEAFRKMAGDKVGKTSTSMQIVNNSRKILFLNAPVIPWHANVWYLERFHFTEERMNPSQPLDSIKFLDVKNRENRKLLQEYARSCLGTGSLTIRNVITHIYAAKKMLQKFGSLGSICDVKEEQMQRYFMELDSKNVQEETYNKHVMLIAKFFSYLVVKQYMKKMPFEPSYYMKKTYARHNDRTVEEKIWKEILYKLHFFPETARLIFLNLWCTGLRISEVCTLRADAYTWDGEDAWLSVYQIKMKDYKRIPIPFALYRVMEQYRAKNKRRPKEYMFQGKDKGAYRTTTFMATFKRHCRKNNIAGGEYLFKSHDYRHTLATWYFDEGISLQTIRDYLGHVTEDMTKQYVDFMPQKVIQANEEFFSDDQNNLALFIEPKKRGGKNGR